MNVFATTAEQRVDELRHSFIQVAIELLRMGDANGCLTAMQDCLAAQARVSGLAS